MTLHITGTGWHGIKSERVLDPHQYTEKSARARLARRRAKGEGLFMVECDDGHWRTGHYALPANIAAALQPCPTCNGKSWVHEDRPGGYGIADPCPDCHEGHPTITVTVPCPTCEGRGVIRHHIKDMYASIRYADPCPTCSAGRVERQAVIHTVLPIVEWADVDIGLDYPLPCITTDPHGNSLLVSDRGPDDFYATHIDLHDATDHTLAADFEVIP
jgi:hypothetical protein